MPNHPKNAVPASVGMRKPVESSRFEDSRERVARPKGVSAAAGLEEAKPAGAERSLTRRLLGLNLPGSVQSRMMRQARTA